MKLWGKSVNEVIEKFTVGNDYLLDYNLLYYDCKASIAHAKMLYKQGLIFEEELGKLTEGLEYIMQHGLKIKQEDEDGHTAIENFLVKNYGEAGKKIHTARSRNDQVLTALRLYEKDKLAWIKEASEELIKALADKKNVKMPGFTHMQKAMPTDTATWLSSFAESMKDNLVMLESVEKVIDQNPLGSGAGFGVSLEIDREFTTNELGFSKVMENPLHCQLSRGKGEAQVIGVLSSFLFDLNKLASDLMLFSMKEFSYLSIPQEFCTGSSIMPQKKNPDVLELVRAKYHVVLGEEMKVKSLASNLMSGYNRDVQLTKEPVMTSLDVTLDCLKVMTMVVQGMQINEENCQNALSDELYATEKVYELVKKGVPFREAYKQVSGEY